MARNARLNATLVLDTSAFQRSMRRIERDLQAFSRSVTEAGSKLTQNLTLPLVGVGAAAVGAFAEMEKLNKGLISIMGTSEMAAEELQKLREVAKLPGLGLKEAVEGSINLQAVGLSADEARTTLFGFGKALAAVGKGKNELNAIQYQLTQMISKNKLLAEDYKVIQSNLPLMAAGMREAFGTQNIDLIRETGISAKDFVQQLSEALIRLPQTQNVTGGLANAFENFTDNLFIAGAELGEIIASSLDLEGVLNKLANGIEAAIDGFKELSPETQKNIIAFAALAASIGPVLIAVGALTNLAGVGATGLGTLAKAASFLLTPVGFAGVAIASLAAIAFKVYQNYRQLNPEIDAFNDYVSEGARNIQRENTEFNTLISLVNSANISSGARSKLINEINTKYAAYLPNLISEKDSLDDIKKAQDAANVAFEKKIRLAALEGIVEKQKARLVELATEELEIEEKLLRAKERGIPQNSVFARSQVTYGQSIADNIATQSSYEASLRGLQKRLDNTKKAQNELTKAAQASQNTLSRLITDLGIRETPDITSGDSTPTTSTAAQKSTKPIDDSQYLAFLRTRKAVTEFANSVQSSVNSVRSNLADLGKSTPIINEQKEALLEYQKQLTGINQVSAVFATNPLAETLSATEQALKSAITEFGPASEAVRVLADEYARLKAEIELANIATQKQADLGQIIATTITSIGQNFSDAIGGVVSFGKAAQKVLFELIGTIVQLIVVRAIEKTIDSPLGKLLGGAIVPVALAAGAAAGQLTKALLSTVKLAEGGLTTGQTLAIVGDNPSGREFIIPFERMGEFLRNFQTDSGMIAEARISGNDLAILVERAQRSSNRTR